MTVWEYRLDDADRERYGGPEWVAFDADALDDVDWEQLSAWDKAFFPSSVNLVAGLEHARLTALGVTGAIWMARQVAGIPTVPFSEFRPKYRKVARRRAALPEEADVDPPASTPSPSEGDPSATA